MTFSGLDCSGGRGPLSGSALELARMVLVQGPVSRAVLAERLSLSVASLTRLSKPLLAAGILREGDMMADGSVGRPVRLLDVAWEAQNFVGVKITGDALQGVLTDMRADPVRFIDRPLASKDPVTVVESLATLLKDLTGGTDLPVAGVGLSLGGQVRPGGEVSRAPFLGWRDVPLGSLAAKRLGLPVEVDNDVAALVAAEQWFGIGRHVSSFAVLTVGAGVGYGLAVRNTVVRTPDTGLGLGGHLPLESGGPLCPLGHRGCATALLSMDCLCTRLASALGGPIDYDEALRLAAAGNAQVLDVFRGAGRALGRMIVFTANLAMVNVIVLAGEGNGFYPFVEDSVLEVIGAHRDPEALPVDVVVLPASSDLWARGAAAVAIQRLAFTG